MYDGERVSSVERASKQKALVSSANSEDAAARRRGSSGGRRKKAKVQVVAGLLKLPLSGTPRPLTRGKLKQLARCCDLNTEAILSQAEASTCPSTSSDGSTASSVGAELRLNV
ncbi:hypothetical protein VPH35_073341 [Triticum aestivum]